MMLREISLIFWLISSIQTPLTSFVVASQLPTSQSVPNKRFIQSASKNVHMGHVPRSGDQFRGNKLRPVTAVPRASSSASEHNGNMTLKSQQLLLENEVSRRCLLLGSALMACEATWAGWRSNCFRPNKAKKKRKHKRKRKPTKPPPARQKDNPPAPPPPPVPQTTRRPPAPQTTQRPQVPQTTRRPQVPKTTQRPQVPQTTQRPPAPPTNPRARDSPPEPPSAPAPPQRPSVPATPQPPAGPAPPPQPNSPVKPQQYPATPAPPSHPSVPAVPQRPAAPTPPPRPDSPVIPQYPSTPGPPQPPLMPAPPQYQSQAPPGPNLPVVPQRPSAPAPPQPPRMPAPPQYPSAPPPPQRPGMPTPQPPNIPAPPSRPSLPSVPQPPSIPTPPQGPGIPVPPRSADEFSPPQWPPHGEAPVNPNININPPDYPDALYPPRRPTHDEVPDSPGGDDTPDHYDESDPYQHSFYDEVPLDHNVPLFTTLNYNDNINPKPTVESQKNWFSFEANIPVNLPYQQRPRNTRCYYNGGKVCIKLDGTICKKPCYKRCKPRSKPCKNYCPSHNTSYNQFNTRKNYKESTNSTNFNPQSPRSRRSVKSANRQGKSGHRSTTNKNVNLNAFHKTHAKSTTTTDQSSGSYWDALAGLFSTSDNNQSKCGTGGQPCEVGSHFTRSKDYSTSDYQFGGSTGGSSQSHRDFHIDLERMARYIASRVVDALPDDLRYSDWAYKFAYDIVLRKLKILESLNSPNSNILPYPPCCCDDEDENINLRQTHDVKNAKTSSVPLTQHLVVHVQSADTQSAPLAKCLPPIDKISAGGYVKANNLAWFKIHHRKEPFDRARSICHDEGAHVANILSLDEVLWLGKHLHDIGMDNAYVGLLASTLRNDSFFTVTDETVGTYVFQQVLTNTRANGKRCVMVSRRKTLSYINCGRQLPFICKVPPSDPCCGRYDTTVGRRP